MKTTYIMGAAAVVLTGAMAAWGINQYLSLKTQLAAVQEDVQAQKTIQPTSVTAFRTAATPSPSPTPNTQPNFDTLPLCDQLDSLDKAGKSLPEFIVNSRQFQEFADQVNTKCPWHREQLERADRILNPPVAAEPSSPNSDAPRQRHTPWNNCDGFADPGESPSLDCGLKQEQTDQTGRVVPGDNRPPYRRNKPHIKNYQPDVKRDYQPDVKGDSQNPGEPGSQEQRPYIKNRLNREVQSDGSNEDVSR
jgi:hypothetical protein